MNLGGSFTRAGLGTFNRTGGAVNLTGTLDNTGATLALNNATGSWTLLGGALAGGTLEHGWTADGEFRLRAWLPSPQPAAQA